MNILLNYNLTFSFKKNTGGDDYIKFHYLLWSFGTFLLPKKAGDTVVG